MHLETATGQCVRQVREVCKFNIQQLPGTMEIYKACPGESVQIETELIPPGQICVAPDYVLCSPELEARILPIFTKILVRHYLQCVFITAAGDVCLDTRRGRPR